MCKVHQSACRVLSYRIMRRIGASINHVNCIFERGTETFVPKHITEFVSAKLPCNLTRTIINPDILSYVEASQKRTYPFHFLIFPRSTSRQNYISSCVLIKTKKLYIISFYLLSISVSLKSKFFHFQGLTIPSFCVLLWQLLRHVIPFSLRL